MKEIKNKVIEDLMPSMVKKWHREFVMEFTKNGGEHSGMMNQTTVVFVKKKSGYVIPAIVNVRPYYSE